MRWSSGTLPTDFTYTGQRVEAGLGGLMDYNARYYDPYLNRWASPDTIVPNPANPQSLNRYSYVLGNPLKYVDPTGHFEEDLLKEWFPDQWEYWQQNYPEFWAMLLEAQFGDVVEAHCGEYTAKFMEGEDGRPYLGDGHQIHTSIDGQGDLPKWYGSPRRNAGYNYQLRRKDSAGNDELFLFGTFSWEQVNDYLYEERYIYYYYAASNFLKPDKVLNADGLLPDAFGWVGKVAGPAASVATKVVVSKVPARALTVVPYVGWAITAADLAVISHNVMFEQVLIERYWVDWDAYWTGPYKWK